MTNDEEFATLWNEFHSVVNMTSRELDHWLRTRAASTHAEAFPDQADQAGPATGRRVLEILGKRKRDLSDRDVEVMREVVGTVRARATRSSTRPPATRSGGGG